MPALKDKSLPVPSKKAVRAINRILRHLATSDFVLHSGNASLAELHNYKLDMALDIDQVFNPPKK